jgi:hypothetical protein
MRYLVTIQSTTIVFNTEINNMVHHVKRGDSSLQTALFCGNIEMVRLLLQWNADVNQANNQVTFNIETVVTKDRYSFFKVWNSTLACQCYLDCYH